MTDELAVAVDALAAIMLPAGTLVARNWPVWERAPFPKPAVRAVYVSLDEVLDGPEVEGNDDAWCPAEKRTRFHAVRRDGSARCWTCGTESLAVAA
ncbi:hypothetical protein [Streptomyces adelaidensis]|uniref:hypothetical protein n=1 Tax=Streptomyces adelaidensis TaxID=2796465 RepID=UPI00190727D1|nr:hypothetical protein [Streptomyces adelaidensis]